MTFIIEAESEEKAIAIAEGIIALIGLENVTRQ